MCSQRLIVNVLCCGLLVAAFGSVTARADDIQGSGTAGRISKFTGVGTIGDSALFESGGNVGIGTTTPSSELTVAGQQTLQNSAVPIIMRETDQTLPRGLWRHVTDGGTYRLDRNTDAAGDFATFAAPFTVWWDGTVLFQDGNVGIGTSAPTEKLTVRGNVLIERSNGTAVLELGDGLDYAEGFDVTEAVKPEPGTVLVIDASNPGQLTVSTKAYDMKVAGIVTGANNLGSGVRLGVNDFDCDVSLAGRVYCYVDATECAIEPGDPLTTSDTAGHAMKATDRALTPGTVLGKAMQSLEKGQKGQILVLVTLQ